MKSGSLIRFHESDQGSGAADISSDILQKKIRLSLDLGRLCQSSKELGFFGNWASSRLFQCRTSSSFFKAKRGSGAAQLGALNQCTPMEILQDVLEHIIPFAQPGCEFLFGCKKEL